MRRILVPLDGSALSEHAIPYGIWLARSCDASLQPVHVIDFPVHNEAIERRAAPTAEAVRVGLQAQADKYGADVPVSCNVLVGDPVQRLLRVSEDDPEAMIVMATHGRGGVVRALLGSVADKVVRAASGPVLLVRPAPDAPPVQPHVGTILVGLDGSEASERSLRHAADLALCTGATLHLVQVVEPLWNAGYTFSPYAMTIPDPDTVQELDRQAADDANAYLAATAQTLGGESVEVTWNVVKGSPVEELIQEASRVSAGMIVVASHGHGGLSRLFQGSVATGLMTRSTLPLLVVPVSALGRQEKMRYERVTTTLA